MEHTSKQFEIELEDLRSGLLAMGGLVEAQFERALQAIASGDEELVDVVLREEKRVNDKQLELDRKSMEIIAKRQPAAVDLRQIICTMQAVNDLERIGDEIKKIAQRARQFQASEFQHAQAHSTKERAKPQALRATRPAAIICPLFAPKSPSAANALRGRITQGLPQSIYRREQAASGIL